jgi:hypothetical protein
MLMYALGGLIGTLMASFGENVGTARAAYTMEALGAPLLIAVGFTAMLVLVA